MGGGTSLCKMQQSLTTLPTKMIMHLNQQLSHTVSTETEHFDFLKWEFTAVLLNQTVFSWVYLINCKLSIHGMPLQQTGDERFNLKSYGDENNRLPCSMKFNIHFLHYHPYDRDVIWHKTTDDDCLDGKKQKLTDTVLRQEQTWRWMILPSEQPGPQGFWIWVLQWPSLASLPPWHTRSDEYGPVHRWTHTLNKLPLTHSHRCSAYKDRLGRQTATYLRAPYCHVVVVLIAELWQKINN